VIEIRGDRTTYRLLALAQSNNLIDFVGPDNRIHFRHVGQNVLSIPFHQTSGYDQLFSLTSPFMLRHLQDGVHRLLLGQIDKTAGVDDDNVRVFRLMGQFVAALNQFTHHYFRVHQILWTA
jgi:hypothetical protein